MKLLRNPYLCCWILLSASACNAQPASGLLEAEQTTTLVEKIQYYLYFPERYETDKQSKFPLLLFLHGGGESGMQLGALKTNGPPKLIAEGKQFPFLILAPQHPEKKKWWNTRSVKQLLDSVIARYRVDEKRIYLTGLSRGGAAAWEMAVQYPDYFAALAVVCGMTPVPYASWIDKDLPIWIFHGTEDTSIPFTESENMVRELKKLGHDVKFTVYEGVGHNAWEKAYNTESLYQWFVNQKRN